MGVGRRWVRMVFALCLPIAATVSACTSADGAGPVVSSVPVAVASSAPAAEIDRMYEAYRAGPLTDYVIAFTVTNHNGMGGSDGDGAIQVRVEAGEVVECDWEPGPRSGDDGCDPYLRSEKSPIEELFRLARRFDPQFASVSYHAKWHFPTLVDFDEPGISDEEWTIVVTQFSTPESDR